MQRRRSQGFDERNEAEQVMQGLDIDQEQLAKAIRRQMIYGDLLTDRQQYMLLSEEKRQKL